MNKIIMSNCAGKPLLMFALMILLRSCTSPDFGVSGVLDRFQQINPKIVFSVEAVSYNMKIHDHLGTIHIFREHIYRYFFLHFLSPACRKLKNYQKLWIFSCWFFANFVPWKFFLDTILWSKSLCPLRSAYFTY